MTLLARIAQPRSRARRVPRRSTATARATRPRRVDRKRAAGAPLGAARRRADRAQGHPRHARARDHRGLEDPRRLDPAVRRDRRRAAARGRRGHPRQGQLRRVRDGLLDRALRVQDDDEPVGHRARPGRQLGRQRGGGRGRPVRREPRHRHRRLDPPARGVLRRRRAQADLRPRLALGRRSRSRRRSIRSARSRARVARRRARARGDRGPRSARLDVARRAGAAVRRRARRRRRRAAHRPADASTSAASIDADVRAALDRTDRRAARRAARPSSTSRCRTPQLALPAYYIVAPAEASSNLARYDGIRFGKRAEADGPARRSTARRAARASAPRSSAGSCSAPTRCARATTTPTTRRRSRSAR